MTACPDRRAAVLAALVAVGLTAGAAAWAQSPPAATVPGQSSTPATPGQDPTATGPDRPEVRTGPVGRPTMLSPLPRSLSPAPRRFARPQELQRFVTTPPAASPSATLPTAAPATGGSTRSIVAIEVDTLGEIDPDSVGVVDPGHGGLAADMWRGTSRELVERLLPLIPGGQRSPALRGLAVRLLLSRATAPEGKRGPKSLLSIRVNRLLALGDVRGAIRLLRAGSIAEDDQDMSFIEVESRFIDNDSAGACQRVRSSGRRFTGLYWQQALSYCLALAGELERSAMIADILRERSDGKDATFFTLVDSLGGHGGVAIDSLPNPHGLHMSMIRATNRKLPADILETQNLAILRTAAFSPNADLDLRLQAAERLIVVGAVTATELIDLYSSLPRPATAVTDPAKAAEADWGPRGRALIIQAAMRAAGARAKIELLREGWAIARKRDGLTILVRASVPLLRALKPSAEVVEFAGETGRILFAHGHAEAALGWLKFALANAATDPKAQKAVAALWPVARLAVADDVLAGDPTRLQAWWMALKAARSKTAGKTAATVYRLFEAVGNPVDAGAWSALVGRPGAPAARAPDSALWRALADASEKGRIGETVIYTLIALGPGGPTKVEPAAMATVVAALKKAGLDKEARALAVEAAIAGGA